MCISNEDRSPAGIHGCNAAPTSSGFADIVSDDFPSISPRRQLDDVVFDESNHKPRPDIQYDGSVRIEERTRT
jgi:hypothetical protein